MELINSVTPTGLKKRTASLPPAPSSSGRASAKLTPDDALEKRRRIVLYFVLALVFMRLSMIHQMLEYLLHVDLYLLYFVAIPALIGVFVTDAFKRAFEYRSAVFWTAFAVWLIPTAIYSTWRGGSLQVITGYYRTEFLILFAIAGTVTTWRECRWLMYTIAVATLVDIASILRFRELDDNGRTMLPFGTVANANDYSAHLIFVLPFLLWVILITKSKYIRIAGFLALGLALYEILAAGSRGAMLGLATATVVFTFTTTAEVRRIVLVAAPVLAVIVFSLLPSSVSQRIFTFSANGSNASSEAIESAQDREKVLRDSIAFTIQHPLLGLGPGQFGNYEGARTTRDGKTLWIEAHNSFAQIASENGFPGFIFYIGGVLSSFLLLNKTSRILNQKPDLEEVKAAVLCVRVGLISFCVAIFFVNFAYFFYLPTLAGIVIAVAASSKQLLAVPTVRKKKRNSKKSSNPLLKLSREIVSAK